MRKRDFILVGTFSRPDEKGLIRPHEDKITFSLAYRTQFFDTTCRKLNLGHAFLLERVQNRALRTECEKVSSLRLILKLYKLIALLEIFSVTNAIYWSQKLESEVGSERPENNAKLYIRPNLSQIEKPKYAYITDNFEIEVLLLSLKMMPGIFSSFLCSKIVSRLQF